MTTTTGAMKTTELLQVESFQGPCFPKSPEFLTTTNDDDMKNKGSMGSAHPACWREQERQSLLEIYKMARKWPSALALPSTDSSYPSTNYVPSTSQSQLVLESPETTTIQPSRKQVVLLQGPIASGKRTLLRALEQSVLKEHEGVCLWIRPTSHRLASSSSCNGYQPPHTAMLQSLVTLAQRVQDETYPVPVRQRLQHQLSTCDVSSNSAEYHAQVETLCQAMPSLVTLFGSTSTQSLTPLTSATDGAPMASSSVEWDTTFRYLFHSMLQRLSDPDHPLLLIVEPLDGASEALWDVLHTMVRDVTHEGLVLIGVYHQQQQQHQEHTEKRKQKDQDTDSTNKRRQTRPTVNSLTKQWEALGASVHTMTLAHIQDETQLQQLLRRSMTGLPQTVGTLEGLTDLIQEHCPRGDLLSLDHFLCVLQDKGILLVDADTQQWTLREDEALLVKDGGASSLNVLEQVQLMVTEFVPASKIELCHFLVCLGPRFGRKMISKLNDDDETMKKLLQNLVSSGIVVVGESYDNSNGENTYFEFAHMLVHDMFYYSIPEKERTHCHYSLGRKLWSKLDIVDNHNVKSDLEETMLLFAVVDHLEMGQLHVTSSSRKRSAIARLSLIAAHIAAKQAAYHTASHYLEFGVSLLGDRRWKDEYYYDQCLELYSALAELALCTTHFRDVEQLADEIIRNATSYADTLHARSAQIYMIGTSGNPTEAVRYGSEVLAHLGVHLPLNPSGLHTKRIVYKTRMLLRGKSDEQILRLPPMKDHEKLSALKILTILMSFCFSVNAYTGPFLAHEIVRLTLAHGICSISSIGFVLFGAILCR